MPETVARYVQALQNGQTIERITVYSDGNSYLLFDGFHRVKAAQILSMKTIEAEIVFGTFSDMEARWQEYLQALREELRWVRSTTKEARRPDQKPSSAGGTRTIPEIT
jgi:hypothetical protein